MKKHKMKNISTKCDKNDSYLKIKRFKNRKAAEKCRISKNIRIANEMQKLDLLVKENENLNHMVKLLEECLQAMHQFMVNFHTGNNLDESRCESVENFEFFNIDVSEQSRTKHFDDFQRISLIEINESEKSLLLSLPDEFYQSLIEFL
jgi:hypothetical protein